MKSLTYIKLAMVALIALCMPRSRTRQQAKPPSQAGQHLQTGGDNMQPGAHSQQGKG